MTTEKKLYRTPEVHTVDLGEVRRERDALKAEVERLKRVHANTVETGSGIIGHIEGNAVAERARADALAAEVERLAAELVKTKSGLDATVGQLESYWALKSDNARLRAAMDRALTEVAGGWPVEAATILCEALKVKP